MKQITLLDAATLGVELDLSVLDQFGNVSVYQTTNELETLNRIKESNIILTNKVVITDEMMAEAKNLELICVLATGTNNIDLVAAEKRGITVKNVKGYSTDSVTQHTFALLFQLIHQVSYYDDYTKTGEYSKSPIFTHLDRPYFQLKGKQFGIIGLGNIGRQVAKVAEAFGAEVSYYSTSGKNATSDFKQKSLEELLSESDVISIHAPLNENTENLIGEKELKMMKPSGILLNNGRGGIVDESALAKAIDNSSIFAAGLDVFEQEPIRENNPLLKVKNKDRLVFSPHIAWASVEARTELLRLTVENIKAYLA